MSRDKFEIPEVFRRAMEEAGWSDEGNNVRKEGGDDGGNGGDRSPFPNRPQQPQPFRINRSSILFGLFFLLLFSVNWIVTTYTDWLWFTELGYRSVWLRQWTIRFAIFAVTFAVAAALLIGNWLIARRRAIRATQPFRVQPLKFPGIRWLIIGGGLFFAFALATSASSQWNNFLRYLYRVEYGTADPIFNVDISFYLFELPIYSFVQGWLLSLLVLVVLGVIPIYAISNLPDIQRGQWRPEQVPMLRQHVAFLGGFILLLWALGNRFDIYNLLYSERGRVFGASYTDMNASLYALQAQMVLMIILALVVFYNVVRLDLRPLFIVGGLWIGAYVLVGNVYPGLLQRYAVIPNEIERERPFIEHNINYTRLAFGLDKIETRTFEIGDPLDEADLIANDTVLKNIRLWDYRPLQDTYEELQTLRTYYQFSSVDIDRYEIDGEVRQVMLAARELNKDDLPAQSWVNLNLEFTHGYGIVMNPVDRVTSDGQPEFFVQDLPPRSNVDIVIDRPEIYYGEFTDDAVFVGSGREEFSYPSGNENVYSSYTGSGGVPLDSYLKRVAYAVRQGDTNILLSDEINSGTRIQYHRQIEDRVRQLTPFLFFDHDPYLIVNNGRLLWMIDAYTVSSRFPYATPFNEQTNSATIFPSAQGINYVRNAAKITIDAYNGEVNYYLTDTEDPIILAYDQAFPGLFQPISAMPEGLQKHVRYPEGLFIIQMRQYLSYHMTDVRVFYNQEDQWRIPTEILRGDEVFIEPYYVILTLPGDDEPEYLLIQPFSPAEKKNMVAWVAARNDIENYGQLVVYKLPKQELVFGPIQVEGRIDQEPSISQQFSLWDQQGSEVIRGNLLVLPINETFLYVEPVYLQSSTSALPELKRVIVATDQRITMAETLGEAIADLLDIPAGDVAVTEAELEVIDGETAVVDPVTDSETTESPAVEIPADATVESLIESANGHFEAAQAAQRAGDWATYGAEIEALESDLARLAELTQ